MNIHVLPGIKAQTEGWAKKLLTELAIAGSDVTIQRYQHWQLGDDSCLDAAGEIERLRGLTVDLLLAKSLGVMLALVACEKGLVTAKKAIFIGTPVAAFAEQDLNLTELAGQLTFPTLFIQQRDDVVGSAASLRQQLGETSQMVEIPGNNHQYKDLKLLSRHIQKWLAAQ